MSILKFKDLSAKGKLRFLKIPATMGAVGSIAGFNIGSISAPKAKDNKKYRLRGAAIGAALGAPVGLGAALKVKTLLGKHLGAVILEHGQDLGSLGGLRNKAFNVLQSWQKPVQREADKLTSLFGGSADAGQAFEKAKKVHTPAIENLYRKAVFNSNMAQERAALKVKDFRFGFYFPQGDAKFDLRNYATPFGGRGLDTSISGRVNPDNPLNILRDLSKNHYRNYFNKTFTKAGLNPDPAEFETLWKRWGYDPDFFKRSVDIKVGTKQTGSGFKSSWEDFYKRTSKNFDDFGDFGNFTTMASQKVMDAYRVFGLDRNKVTHKNDIVKVWRKRAAELMRKTERGDKVAEAELKSWNAAYNMIKIDDKPFFDKLAEVLREMAKPNHVFNKIASEVYFGRFVDKDGNIKSYGVSSSKAGALRLVAGAKTHGLSVKDKKFYRFADKNKTSSEIVQDLMRISVGGGIESLLPFNKTAFLGIGRKKLSFKRFYDDAQVKWFDENHELIKKVYEDRDAQKVTKKKFEELDRSEAILATEYLRQIDNRIYNPATKFYDNYIQKKLKTDNYELKGKYYQGVK